MKLLYVCNDYGIRPSGVKGASVHLRAVTGALCALGHEVMLVSPHDGPEGEHPVRALVTGGSAEIKSAVSPLKRWLIDQELGEGLARDLRPVFFNTWAPQRVLEALDGAHVDAVIERLASLSTVGMELAQTLGVPLAIEANALMTQEARSYRTLALSEMSVEIERRTLNEASAVMAVSAELGRQLIEAGAAEEKVFVVPNGVEGERFYQPGAREGVRRELGINGRFVVGFSGSLKPWHGVDLLMRAFAMVYAEDREACLLIVGDGPMRRALEALAVEAKVIDAVIFTGAVAHDRMPQMLSAMDVGAAPYPAIEDFYFSPIKLFEYMAAGCAVVASAQGQIGEVIEHERTGLVCPPGDVVELAACLKRLRRDLPLRRGLGDAARLRVAQRHTWRGVAERITAILHEVCGHGGRGSIDATSEARCAGGWS